MKCARAFHDFNSRAADVTTQRDPQVSLFLFCTSIFLKCMYFNVVLKSVSKVFPSIITFVHFVIEAVSCNREARAILDSLFTNI